MLQNQSRRIARTTALALLVIAPLAACDGMRPQTATATKGPVMAERSLYDRLGGKPAITAVVDRMVANIAANPAINARFAGADIPGLKSKLVDQVCEATGGPCRYTGLDMKTAHAGMMITDQEFDALAGDLVEALDFYKVPEKEKAELLAAIGGMRGDIVGM
jgi:hemoglobin